MFDMLMGKKEGGLISVEASVSEAQPATLKEMIGKMALTAIAANDAAALGNAMCMMIKAAEMEEGESY